MNTKQGDSSGAKLEYQSAATKLLTKRRELYDAYERFEKEKVQFTDKEQRHLEEEQRIRDEDADTQKDLINYSKFLQSNQNEKQKCKRRYNEEKKSNHAKTEELKKLDAELMVQKELAEKISRKANMLRKYDEYLTSVINANQDQFQNLNELLMRHRTLQQSNEKLEHDRHRIERETEEVKSRMNTFEKEKANQILLLSNELAMYIEKAENLEHARLALENELESNLKSSFEDMVLGGRIFMAIHNLHHKAISFNSSLKKSHNANSKPVNNTLAKRSSPEGSNSPKKLFLSK